MGECHSLVAKCLGIKGDIVMVTTNLWRIIIETEFQLVVKSIHGKICVSNGIIVKDVRMLSYLFKDNSIDYYGIE